MTIKLFKKFKRLIPLKTSDDIVYFKTGGEDPDFEDVIDYLRS
ncbi:hypothetical protein [Lentibacillus daqui]|nr:hypothetical protein [Lentibacillus daqui]